MAGTKIRITRPIIYEGKRLEEGAELSLEKAKARMYIGAGQAEPVDPNEKIDVMDKGDEGRAPQAGAKAGKGAGK